MMEGPSTVSDYCGSLALTWSHGGRLGGPGDRAQIPSFASLTLDLVIVPYLKKKRRKLEIISSNPVLSWRKRARHREGRELTKVPQWSQAPRPARQEKLTRRVSPPLAPLGLSLTPPPWEP